MNGCTRFRGKGDWDAQEKDRASVYFHYLNRLIFVCELFKNKRKLHKGIDKATGVDSFSMAYSFTGYLQ